jgi:hypothetical protein
MIFNSRTLRIEFIFLALIYSFSVWFFSDLLLLAHESGGALFFSSDGPGYYQHYLNYIEAYGVDNMTSNRFFTLLLNKTPVALLVLFSGDVSIVILCSGVIAILSVYVLLSNIDSIKLKRRLFLLLFFVPFFSFGFFSINKEIYVGSATIFFLSYILTKDKKIFFYSLLVALIGKPLFAIILILAFIGVNFFSLRYFMLFLLFLFFTWLPFSGFSIPGAPSFQIHEDGGRFSKFTTLIISNGGYFFVYPIKYLGNILLKLSTAFSVGSFDRPTMYLDIFTSITFIIQIVIVLINRNLICYSKTGKVLFFMVLFLPVPLLFFNFSQVRYIYFIQIFCVYLIVMLPFYRKNKRHLLNINFHSGGKCGV